MKKVIFMIISAVLTLLYGCEKENGVNYVAVSVLPTSCLRRPYRRVSSSAMLLPVPFRYLPSVTVSYYPKGCMTVPIQQK